MPIYGYSIHPHSNVILHQTENKKMKPKTELPEELCADEAVCFIADRHHVADEAVCFIADRHHVTPQQLLRHFLYGEVPANAATPVRAAIPLEPNEIKILKGLSGTIKD